MSLHWNAALLTVLLSGCTTLIPPHTLPESTLPTHYQQGYDTNTKDAAPASAANIAWQDYFRDPHLQKAILQALRHNQDLRSAALRVQQAQAAYRIERSAQLPGVSLGIDAKRSRTPSDLSDTGSALSSNEFQVSVGVTSWEIDLWGRIASLNEEALQAFLETNAGHRAVTISLVAQVADTWLSLYELNERLRLAQATQANQSELLRIFTRRFEVGAVTKLELTQVQTLVNHAEGLVLQLQQQRDLQRNALNLLVGRADLIDFNYKPFANAPLLQPLDAGLPSDLLTNRPDIVAAEHRLRAANAHIGAARAAFFPRISLTTFGGLASGELSDLLEGSSRAWNFAPSLSLPIFDGGRNQANLDLAEVRKDLAVVEYEQTIQSAFRDVADALANQHWLQQQLSVQQQAVEIQAERSRLAHLSHERGRTSFLEVLDAERDRLETEQQKVQAQHALLRSQVALYAALGGGTQHLPPADQPVSALSSNIAEK
ncbi:MULTISPECIES: efflux transporter outer membrane subunit [unclassified Halomonas]|uniref:efflux transporter outer membrane subunit n=1 Tax=unclassified Halomonas TaxID=2609666 RepID=UPI0018FE8634|nr:MULTISPECIES: efflux transporter outer membrane subunit [unclassified Halomonas]